MLDNPFQCPNPGSFDAKFRFIGAVMASGQRALIARKAGELAGMARHEGLDLLAYLLEIAAREAQTGEDKTVPATLPGAFADATYLRAQASRCVRLAREYQSLPVSHDLEILGVELMEKAVELERFLTGQANPER